MYHIVFMGTPEFAVPTLRSLVQKHHVLAVFTQPDKPAKRGMQLIEPPVKKCALELGVPVYQPEKIKEKELKLLQSLQPDFLVVAAYGHILKKEILNTPKINALNIHSSLLPRWRGAAPIQWSLLEGDQKSGVSIMKMVEKLDAGEVYEQVETTISPHDNAQTLHDRLSLLGASALETVLKKYQQSQVVGVPQEESLVTYAKKLNKEMEVLNPFERSAEELDRHIRAFYPWPGTSLYLENLGRIKIKKACPTSVQHSYPVGTLFVKNSELILSTHQGELKILTLQEEGKKEMQSIDFINGLNGRKLPSVYKVIKKEMSDPL